MIFYKELHYFKVIKVFNFAYSAKKIHDTKFQMLLKS